MRSLPFRAHYLGYIIRVVAYGRGYAGGMFWGAIHPEMGRRNGALCTLPDFPVHLSHKPGLWTYSGHQYRHVRTTLAGHIRAAARPQHVRPDDTTTHTHTCTLRCTAHSSTRSWLDCRAPTSIIHLPTNRIVSNSFLTVFRAPDMPPAGKPVDPSTKK